MNDAVAVAEYLLRNLSPLKCEAIGLFGSVARNGEGNDLDIIVFVPLRFQVKQFFTIGLQLKQATAPCTKEAKRHVRRLAAVRVLELERLTSPGVDETVLDILIYWFAYSIEDALAHMKAIADQYEEPMELEVLRDILIFDPGKRQFVKTSCI